MKTPQTRPHPLVFNSSPRAASSGSELDPGEPSVRLLFRPALSILLLVPFCFLHPDSQKKILDLSSDPHSKTGFVQGPSNRQRMPFR